MVEPILPNEDTISIVAVAESNLRADESRTPILKDIGVQQFSRNLQQFLGQLDQVLASLNDKVGGFEIDELEVYAEVSAEGKVSLMGTGVQTGATGGLKLILRRPSAK